MTSELLEPGTSPKSSFNLRECKISYALFNDGWDLFVDNWTSQTGARLGVEERTHALVKYLEYLVHSLSSLRRTHAVDPLDVEVRLVELSPLGLRPEQVRAFLARRLGGWAPEVVRVPHDSVAPFIDEVMSAPARPNRSPNRFHEFVLLDAIRASRHRYLAIVDPDVTFLAADALSSIGGALLARPEKWIAACLERSLDKPWNGQVLRTRERMHSVLLFANARAFQESFPFEPFLRVSPLSARLAVLEDGEARDYYERCGVLDTLSIVTDWLGHSRIMDLQEVAGGFREGSMLTIVGELMIHAKYLDRGAARAVRETIAACPAALTHHPSVREILCRCRDASARD